MLSYFGIGLVGVSLLDDRMTEQVRFENEGEAQGYIRAFDRQYLVIDYLYQVLELEKQIEELKREVEDVSTL